MILRSDNEPTSLRNIAALYEKECKDAELLKQLVKSEMR